MSVGRMIALIAIPFEGRAHNDLLFHKAMIDHEIIIVQPVVEDDRKIKNYPHKNLPFIIHSVAPSTEFFETEKNPETKTSRFATLLSCLKQQIVCCSILESLASVCEKPPKQETPNRHVNDTWRFFYLCRK